jgi:hypothetical protein
MANLEYYDDDPLPIDLVYHAVFSDSYAIDIIIAAQLPAATGARITR